MAEIVFPRDGDRRKRADVVIFALVVVLVAALLVGAVTVLRGGEAAGEPVRTIRLAGDLEYFDDPDVQRELARNGFRVEQNRKGTVGIADLPDLATDYDLANAGSGNAADHIITVLKDEYQVAASTISPFSSPMVIITYQLIVALLEKLNIARKSANGTWVFDVSAHLGAVRDRKKWSDIPDNADYRSTNQVLLSTTDPTQSNSGAMLLAIETYVANDSSPVTDVAAFKKAKPDLANSIKHTFIGQGYKIKRTRDLLDLIRHNGMSRYPMSMIYERDYISAKLNGDFPLDRAVLMYPNPTVISDNNFVWWGEAGRDFANLLSTDQTLIDLAEKHGYHTRTDPIQFAKDVAAKGVTIANLDDPKTDVTVALLPTEEILTQLIAELGK